MALTRVLALSLVATSMSNTYADEPNEVKLSRAWLSQPSSTAESGASVRVGVGHVEHRSWESGAPIAMMMIVRPRVRVHRALQIDLSLGGELSGESMELSSPVLAATWLSDLDPMRLAVRGTASPAIANRLSSMGASVASSLLAHDPLVAWSSAHALGLQVSLQGGSSALWWGAAASITELVPTDLPRHQTLVRADAALAGPLNRCWTWSVELGASSDVLDEEFDEGTDLVPMWSAGAHHHRGAFSIGMTTTGGYMGGTRGDLLGPSFLIDMRGPL